MMADDEDIPANFLEEDKDLLEDKHLQEDEHLLEDKPVCKRRLLFYTLEQKKKIVHEAYSQPHHVQLTARKRRVQPVQIRQWSVQLQADAVLPAYPYPRTVEERTIIKDHKKLKTQNEGRPV
jgi:hypothetical protein